MGLKLYAEAKTVAVFGPDTTQQRLFDEVASDTVKYVAEGYNTTIFACECHFRSYA